MVSGFSNWRRSPIQRRCPTRSRRFWASPSNPERAWGESVAAALEGRVRLLVFDNCEHVLDAAADLVEAKDPRQVTLRRGLLTPDRGTNGPAQARPPRIASVSNADGARR